MTTMNPGLVRSRERSHVFGRHDRLVIDGQSFRVDRKVKDTHVLQPVSGDLIAEDYFVPKTDGEINKLLRSKRIRIDEGYYSKTLTILRVRHDDSDLGDLSEAELRTVAWKTEWCVRFLREASNPEGRWRPRRTLDDYGRFIEMARDAMDRWYLDQFGERRRPGRRLPGEARKPFDYPSPSGMRKWLGQYLEANCRMECFRPHYSNSGNRNQIDPRAVPVIAAAVQKYCSILRPKMADICEDVELALEDLNSKLPEHRRIRASANAVRRRIHAIDPFVADAGRHGPDYAFRKYAPVGRGIEVIEPFARIEMDDWEKDLFTLVKESTVWKTLAPEKRKKIPRIRCSITAAIDCATRCIVGFNLTVNSPSTATARSALRSIMVDKTDLAELAGAEGKWDIYSRPGNVVTDGGPAFGHEFDETARKCLSGRTVPDQDPRMRGTIESFFRTLKRLCRYFAGRSFANVVERGDYAAEELASLTVAEFHMAIVRFIVDHYHHRPHRGLEGGTPYGRWLELSGRGLPPPPSDQQLMIAFGLSAKKRAISKHGVELLGLSYNSMELALLRGLVGQERVDVIVDSEDLGAVLVRIPKKHMGRIRQLPAEQEFLMVPSVDGIGASKTLVDMLMSKKAVRAYIRKEQDAGRPLRLNAHRDLLDLAETARKAAGIPSNELTQKQFDLLMAEIERSARAGMHAVEHGEAEQENDDIGELVALPTRRRASPGDSATPALPSPSSDQRISDQASKPTPFGGSMNLYGEDE